MAAASRLLVVAAAAVVYGCGGGGDVVGTWSQLNPADGTPTAGVLKIHGDGTWDMTGFPALSGTYTRDGGKVRLRIEEVDGKDRATAIKETPGIDMDQQLKDLDQQLAFKVVTEGDATFLEQTGPNKVFKSGFKFRKQKAD